MCYDDGYEELLKREAEDVRLVKGCVDNNYLRAYRLSNGDIFTVCNVTVKFVDNVLYEVVEDGEDVMQEVIDGVTYRVIQTKWAQTGKVYTIDQLNELLIETKGE